MNVTKSGICWRALFHTNKNAEYILYQWKEGKVSWPEGLWTSTSIPLIAGDTPSRFACLWAKLIRINQPHCSQVGVVGQLKADTSLGSAGGKLGMVGTLPYPPWFSLMHPQYSLLCMPAALWDLLAPWPGDLCLNRCPLQPALTTSRVRWGSMAELGERTPLDEAQRYHNWLALIILVMGTSQGYKAVSILRTKSM